MVYEIGDGVQDQEYKYGHDRIVQLRLVRYVGRGLLRREEARAVHLPPAVLSYLYPCDTDMDSL